MAVKYIKDNVENPVLSFLRKMQLQQIETERIEIFWNMNVYINKCWLMLHFVGI